MYLIIIFDSKRESYGVDIHKNTCLHLRRYLFLNSSIKFFVTILIKYYRFLRNYTSLKNKIFSKTTGKETANSMWSINTKSVNPFPLFQNYDKICSRKV